MLVWNVRTYLQLRFNHPRLKVAIEEISYYIINF